MSLQTVNSGHLDLEKIMVDIGNSEAASPCCVVLAFSPPGVFGRRGPHPGVIHTALLPFSACLLALHTYTRQAYNNYGV